MASDFGNATLWMIFRIRTRAGVVILAIVQNVTSWQKPYLKNNKGAKMKLRSNLYSFARLLGDANAVAKGQVVTRFFNRVIGRMLSRLFVRR